MLDIFMNQIGYDCQYKAVSQGITIIQGINIGHVIFPFKGELSLYDIIRNKDHYDSYKKFYPKILRDVIICLKEINNFAIHGDIKLDNIVIEKSTINSFIIDFGLATLFPISIDSLQNLNVGNRQISIEIIIGYLVKIQNNTHKDIFDSYYIRYLEIIGKTIDNFGLFWIIMESIFDINIFEKYFPDQKFLVRLYNKSDINLLNNYLNFYFNLDYQDLSKCNQNSLYLKLTNLFEYKGSATFRQGFIDYIFSRLDANKFNMYFNNDKSFFDRFIINILALVKVDPRERITKEKLLMDPFFSSLPPKYAPPNGPPPKNKSSFPPQYYAPPNGPPPKYYAPPNGPPPKYYAPPNGPPPKYYAPPNGPPPQYYAPPNGPPPKNKSSFPPQYYAPPNRPPPKYYAPPNGPPPKYYAPPNGPPPKYYAPPNGPPPKYNAPPTK
jgi:serine/threonine protein kinase